jgi:hypothetical protein
MSLPSQNPYVVSKKGLFTTNTPEVVGLAQPQAGPGRVRKRNGMKHSDELPEDEEEIVLESSDDNTHSKHFKDKDYVGFYLNTTNPMENLYVELPNVDMTNPKNNQIIEYVLPMILRGYSDLLYQDTHADKETKQKPLSPVQTLSENNYNQEHLATLMESLKSKDSSILSFLNNMHEKHEKQGKLEEEDLIVFLKKLYTEEEIKTKYPQLAESNNTLETSQPEKKWTVRTNTCPMEEEYDCMHICFTETDTIRAPFASRQHENFYLFFKRSPTKESQKYLVLYQGTMMGLIRKIQNEENDKGEKVNHHATLMADLLRKNMDELTRPDENGIRYFECVDSTDQGYWHDHAHEILKHASSYGLVDKEKKQMSKFVHTIAKSDCSCLTMKTPSIQLHIITT